MQRQIRAVTYKFQVHANTIAAERDAAGVGDSIAAVQISPKAVRAAVPVHRPTIIIVIIIIIIIPIVVILSLRVMPAAILDVLFRRI